jgi:hypothetical protein
MVQGKRLSKVLVIGQQSADGFLLLGNYADKNGPSVPPVSILTGMRAKYVHAWSWWCMLGAGGACLLVLVLLLLLLLLVLGLLVLVLLVLLLVLLLGAAAAVVAVAAGLDPRMLLLMLLFESAVLVRCRVRRHTPP